ncbi:hypothetical protein Aph01nite_18360 [Acrocarpospora phusangensis]|uniref:Uncharacterized protein n=1 Tax=Acrocarpospora phusangensis TaxID=1070424 RepID=A0A919Q8L6_9ACTN|nr:hypothetical protein [Acrocarpospora phusangensis]GIH23526.1 hypothetical protein Aph01nite_18360 [Acrocarpospora phusangensis]
MHPDRVHQDAGHFDAAGVDALGDALDLRQGHAAAVLDRLRRRQGLGVEPFVVHHQIALLVGDAGADDGDVDRERVIVQPLPAPQFD